MIRAVFFDLYGTLVDETHMGRANEQWTESLNAYLIARGGPLTDKAKLFWDFWGIELPREVPQISLFVERRVRS